ncbi:GntR family transcriptional regulator [Streptomyces sp. ACA25]|uniref:GntR family transcriptional regulator n=1 Tax=Streptomyces sp. ACA25 TaxID=3022596 RepID=UPI002307819F|nr:GntR family transcriptional regulator [Streptomyces sp. ACA25]MDB1088812.1 GntR family transcriptional regulator [Streptomyces sp. ACA25]
MRISAQAVCTAIRDDIIHGVLPPGSRLAEEQLAHRYGVSRVPVREALRTLESEGFVVSRRHAGACVAQPGNREAADLLDVRMLVEPLGAARAAQRRTEAHLKVLRGLVRLGRQRSQGQGQSTDLRPLGDWFHETVAQATCSPGLAALLVQLHRKITWLYAGEPASRTAVLWQERGSLVDAIARRDAERARALSSAQLERFTPARKQQRQVSVRTL